MTGYAKKSPLKALQDSFRPLRFPVNKYFPAGLTHAQTLPLAVEERWKTTIGLISKKKEKLCTCSSLFLYISLPLFCTTTTWNFQKLLSCTFYGGNVVRVLVHFFFIATHYHLALVAATFSYFVTAATKFSCCSSNKKNVSFVFFFSRSRSLSPFLSLSFAGLQPDFHFSSVLLLLYIPNLWTCRTMNLSWIL